MPDVCLTYADVCLTYAQVMLEQQDVMRKQLEHQKSLLDREKVWRETQHTEELEALKARYEGRIQQLSAEATQVPSRTLTYADVC